MDDGIIIGFMMGVIATLVILGAIMLPQGIHSDAYIIKHGCGEYNTTTGKFQWKKEGEK
jgi:hypothetical protein